MKWALFKDDVKYLLLNGVVGHFPCWAVRKKCYQRFGIKIGKGSHILLGTRIMGPEGITIGDDTVINEECILDGRFGLHIGNHVSVSMQTALLTGQHDKDSDTYAYVGEPIEIGDNVWLCTRATVLPGSVIDPFAVIAAGAVVSGKVERGIVCGGVPAKPICKRREVAAYNLNWSRPLR